MVGQYSKRLNNIKRGMLVAGIVAIGLLDLAFSTYIGHQDLLKPPTTSGVEVKMAKSETDHPLPTLADDEPNELVEGPLFTNSYSISHSVRPSHVMTSGRAASRIAPPSQIVLAKNNMPTAACRTTSYVLVNDSYVVTVSDDLGCISTTLSRYSNERVSRRHTL